MPADNHGSMLSRASAFFRRSKLPSDAASGEVKSKYHRAPVCLRIRSSTWFIALVVGFGGEFLATVCLLSRCLTLRADPPPRSPVLVDLSSYSLAVPVIPFRLQELGYGDVGGKTGWLVSAYAGGLIVSSPPVAVLGAKYKNRQIPLFLGLIFMAVGVVLFMEAKTFGQSSALSSRRLRRSRVEH